ncbi:ABC transporter ATP-binding protein [Lachnoclostridium sp. An138]|uniref:ABC transporter ATP-binding protein n=1 Tax=Lachnoclostridium sp. An138 TaxID=1965560 RepID=UPI000B372593|nr:ABC transporter ATP-binding protein [Lachnoclostridium sp. An138]OUQ20663.1 ABC transporter ATP-binding protein [Lachnoclostridium sp. An138]
MELCIDRLTKQYGHKLAVDRVDLELHQGVYGLLGANGAGKTTLMRMLCDILTPTSGEIRYNGQEIGALGEDYRSCLGYLPQNFGYYPEFTAEKFLLYLAALKGLGKIQAGQKMLELLDLVGLAEERKHKIRTFSGGMKQRLGIAQALLNDPEILILDEPTAGLDPKERVRFRNLISACARDRIVLLSTHIVSDVEYIAGEILVMKEGRLIHRGAPDVITREIEGKVWECQVDSARAEELCSRYNVGNLKNAGDKTILRIIGDKKPEEEAVPAQPTLEDLYLYYFQEEER